MLKSSESNHEYFEELCALALIGQISAQEYEEFVPHFRACASCRARYSEFAEILHEHLPLLDSQKELFADSPKIAFHDSSYKHRFIKRAQRQGIEFTDSPFGAMAGDQTSMVSRSSWHWMGELLWPPGFLRYAFLLTFVALGLTAGVAVQKTRESHLSTGFLGETTRLKEQIGRLQLRMVQLSEVRQPARTEQLAPDLKVVPLTSSSDRDALQAQLWAARQSYAAQASKARSLELQLQKNMSELESMRGELAVLQSKTKQADNLNETELALRQAREEIEKLQRIHANDLAALSIQNVHLRELSEKLNNQGDSLERERELLTAGRDIRDLMGARNLHIIDVADVDSQGTKRPFGRVFYTEGKSLIFYAYDFEWKKKLQERYSFQAWGQRESKSGSAQNLGIFFVDDQAQNRWVLKYDDPSVLAEIDAVFVTLEPKGGSLKPKGQQLMYAYLKANPNHP